MFRHPEQYSMFATLAGSKLSLLITDVMSSNSWIFMSCGRHFQLVSLSFKISSISWSIGFLTSSNRSQSRMKCSIFSLSLLHSKQSIFDSFLNIFIRLLWNMYEPVRERPFNLKGGKGYVFFLKKYSDSQCC
jgi:hypothetical protein